MLELQIKLALEEAEEKRIQADRAALEKRLRDGMEMMAANEYLKKLNLELQRQQDSEEEDFRRQMMDKFREDERIEQMNAQKPAKDEDDSAQARGGSTLGRELGDVRARKGDGAGGAARGRAPRACAQVSHRRGEDERQMKILVETEGKLGLAYLPLGVLSSMEDLEMFKDMGAK